MIPTPPEPDLDAAIVQRQARLAGLDLDRSRAERLLSDLAALARADRRLAALDPGSAAPAGPPWGRPSDD
jgi:hypothetical protein